MYKHPMFYIFTTGTQKKIIELESENNIFTQKQNKSFPPPHYKFLILTPRIRDSSSSSS